MNTIKEKRLALGMSQTALAEAIGVDPASVRHWECGRNKPTKPVCHELCAVLQCAPEDLGIEMATLRERPGPPSEGDPRRANWERAREYAERRCALCLTQAQLAKKADVHVSTIVALENGRTWPVWDTRQKIRRALGMPEERYYSVAERNALFLEMQESITWIVRKNQRRIQAVHMSPEDVWQDLAVCALRAIDRFRPDGGAALKTFVERSANFKLEDLLVKFYLHGLSGKLHYPLPDIYVNSYDALMEARYQAEEADPWDCGYEENRPWC